MTALQDRVSMIVERADFDDLVTLVTQAPPWEKDRSAGVRILLRAIAEGKANAPDQILQRWTWKLARATRKVQDRRASAEFPEAKRLLGAVANSRGHRHEENVLRLVQVAKALPLDVGAALIASADGYTPRANAALDRAREELGETIGDRRRARRQPARAEGALPQVAPPQAEEEDRRWPAATARDGSRGCRTARLRTARPRTAASPGRSHAGGGAASPAAAPPSRAHPGRNP